MMAGNPSRLDLLARGVRRPRGFPARTGQIFLDVCVLPG